jgi:hypothetical protein
MTLAGGIKHKAANSLDVRMQVGSAVQELL